MDGDDREAIAAESKHPYPPLHPPVPIQAKSFQQGWGARQPLDTNAASPRAAGRGGRLSHMGMGALASQNQQQVPFGSAQGRLSRAFGTLGMTRVIGQAR
ncbi:MAG: hypothetical protein ABSF15_12660 [Candidatus Sulfotelmatobacter sp.]